MTKTSIKISLIPTIFAVSVAVLNCVLPTAVYGISPLEVGVLSARSEGQPDNLFGAEGIFTTISSVMLFAIGALSVLMIIVGGIRYVLSGGKEASITKAKNTILYAIIGVIVAMLAYAIINFVIGTFVPGVSNGGTNV